MVLGTLSDLSQFLVTRPRSLPTEVIELDGTGTPAGSGPLHLQSFETSPTLLPRFKEPSVLYGMEFQEMKAVTGAKITSQRNKRKRMMNLAAIPTAIKLVVPVEAG